MNNHYKSGIYAIINTTNGHRYIGSALKISLRWNRHRKDLRGNKHHSQYLQRAWNKYGESNFVFEVIENCDRTLIIEREKYYIDTLAPVYNVCPNAGSALGRKTRPEVRLKASLRNKALGVKPPEITYELTRRPIRRTSIETGEIKDYRSILDALKDLGKSISKASYLSQVANKKPRRKSAYGFRWEYLPRPSICQLKH